MKLLLTSIAVIVSLSLTSCRRKEPTPPEEQPTQKEQPAQAHPPQQPPRATVSVHAGTVQEVIQASAYTYLNVKEQDATNWIAINKKDVKVGDTVSYASGLEMKNFTSKDLQRTFETIYFVSDIRLGSQGSAATAAPTTSHQGKVVPEKMEVSVEPVKGGISIGQLYSNKASYANKTVRIRGKVTKVNRAIMGMNWIHLQDGTGDSQNYDLTVTTHDDAVPGEVVTFEGTIILNKDFGAGYAYDVLMQNGSRQKE